MRREKRVKYNRKVWFQFLEDVHPSYILPFEKEIMKKIHPNSKLEFPQPIIVQFEDGINGHNCKVLGLDDEEFFKERKKRKYRKYDITREIVRDKKK